MTSRRIPGVGSAPASGSALDCLTVADADTGTTVLCASAGASWGLLCQAADCPAGEVMGYAGPAEAAAGAAEHLGWHAAGCPDDADVER